MIGWSLTGQNVIGSLSFVYEWNIEMREGGREWMKDELKDNLFHSALEDRQEMQELGVTP